MVIVNMGPWQMEESLLALREEWIYDGLAIRVYTD